MRQANGVERREFQRLRLDQSIPATFNGIRVTLVDIGVLGARILHRAPFTDSRGELHFIHGSSEIAMKCEIVRTADHEHGQVSGLRFVAAVGDSGDHLRHMLAGLVSQALEQRMEASRARIHIGGIDGDQTLRGVDANFVSFMLDKGAWRRRPALLPEQPATGFTVARGEDADEMRRLCTIYEASDEEGRRLIRMFAELSVSDALQIPQRS